MSANNSNIAGTAAEVGNNVMTINGVAISAQTPAGAQYVRKVTHPPTTIPSGYTGTPDASQPNFVAVEVKGEVNIPTTYQLATSATAVSTNFPSSGRILVVSPSGGYVSSYVFYWTGQGYIQATNQTFQSGVRPAVTGNVPATTTSGYNFNNFNSDFNMFRTVYKSNTYYLNATEFNDQGQVITAKFKPSIVRGNVATLARSMPHAERQSFLRAIRQRDLLSKKPLLKSKKADCDSVSGRPLAYRAQVGRKQDDFEDLEHVENDDDDVRDVEFDYDVQIIEFPSGTGTVTPVAFNAFTNTITGVLPATPSDVLTSSPKGVSRMAKEGAFVVAQPINPTQEWSAVVDGEDINAGLQNPSGTIYSLMRVSPAAGGAAVYVALYNGNSLDSLLDTTAASDIAWNNLDWSYTMFDGLSQPTFNTSGIPINAPYITDKCYMGIEGAARSSGSLLSFQKLLPLPDPEALQMATGIFHARPDSLPATANDFGTIATVAAKFLPTALNWLSGVFSNRRGANQRAPPRAQRQQPRAVRAAPARTNNRQIAALTNMVANLSVQRPTPMRSFTNTAATGQINSLYRAPRRTAPVSVRAARSARPVGRRRNAVPAPRPPALPYVAPRRHRRAS
jgi:hypothetical protein